MKPPEKVSEIETQDAEGEDRVFRVGDVVVANQELGYCMGQAPEDKIEEGEACTICEIDAESESFYFNEHADRYGPWPAMYFTLQKPAAV